MLTRLLEHKARVGAVIGFVLLLACVRAFENELFYDPLIAFYKSDFTSMPWPEMDKVKLSFHLFLRYFLNSALSLAIIYAIFKTRTLVRFTALLYAIFFILLIGAFFAALTFFEDNKMLLFYIRRFIIQPLFLLLFIPAYYCQERIAKKNNVS